MLRITCKNDVDMHRRFFHIKAAYNPSKISILSVTFYLTAIDTKSCFAEIVRENLVSTKKVTNLCLIMFEHEHADATRQRIQLT